MGILTVAVEHYLDSQNWKYAYEEDDKHFHLRMKLESFEFCNVYIQTTRELIITYAVLPIHVPEMQRDAVCRYLARANYNLLLGNFEMDLRDGEVRYKTTLYVRERIPTQIELELHVDLSFHMLDRYAQGLLGILFGGMDDKQAIAVAEGVQDET